MSGNRSVVQIEAEIAVTRERLAATIDELAYRAQPRTIVRREVDSAKQRFTRATRYDDGTLRTERITAVLGASAAVLLGIGLLRRVLS
ncbi:MAG: DUF3618 domain-containing protein [Dermatophilaceae bacterium]